ncbi:hypothetical protein [Ideonella livida]|uniref:hypothetical protein n=1 Tax=Ideonella livida TaxID=2707176 RepID=UPI00194037BA|nr:hypothetical protein [Ideonella livida]
MTAPVTGPGLPLSRRLMAALGGLALLNLLLAAGGGLARLGGLPPAAWGPTGPSALGAHGAVMVGGFFGTVIALERVAALHRGAWVPALAGLGGLLAGLAGATLPAAWPLAHGLWGLSATGLLGLYAWAARHRGPSLPLAVEASAAAALLAGHLANAAGQAPAARLGYAAFLVLTIAAERRELMRLRPLSVWAGRAFVLGWLGTLASVALAWHAPEEAARLWWALMVGLAVWLLCFDVARLQWRAPAWAGHTARCLGVGYLWLGLAAVLGLAGVAGAWHVLWLGFVWAMVFGHAPLMLPTLAGWRPRHTAWALLPLAVMGLSLGLRLAAEAWAGPDLRAAAGLGHALAWLLFGGVMAMAVRAGDRHCRPTDRLRARPTPADPG